MATKIKLTDVRITFIDSLTGPAKDYQDNKVFRHSATFLIEPGSANDKAILSAIDVEAKASWAKKATAMLESIRGNSNKYCYTRGDLKDYDGFQGMMALSGHRKQVDGRPLLLDSNIDPETGKLARLMGSDDKFFEGKAGRLFAGCYVNASVEIYAQQGQNAGIRCGLMVVQFARAGDSFGGAARPTDDDFESIQAPAEDDLA